jgi:phosphoenolpyruvate-protein kinase (PTS system EI component)
MRLLIGLGFRAFSVEPVLIPRLAATVRTAHSAQYAPLLRRMGCFGNLESFLSK